MSDMKYLFKPPLPEGGGGILFYICPSKIFFVAFFSVTVDGRNLIFGHKCHIDIPSCNNVAPVTNLCLGRVSEHLGFYYYN